jgi:hypothetical protein
MVRREILSVRARVGSVSTRGKQTMIGSLEAVVASEAKQSLRKSHDGVVKMSATQIKLDARTLGDRWMEVLERALASTDTRNLL